MRGTGRGKRSTSDLRRRAEALVVRRGTLSTAKNAADTTRILHELQVHQVELEMQNEELQAARIEVEQGLARYTELFDFAPIGYASLTLDGHILAVNHTGARLLGHPRSRLVGKAFAAFVAPDSFGVFKQFVERVLGSDVREECEVGFEPTPGAPWQVHLSAYAVRTGETTLLLAFEDITAKKAKEAQLATAEEALREANRRKDEFLAMLSHELRNPLAPIRNCIFLLSKVEPGSEQSRKAVAIIDRQTAHLARLVDDLLDITRIMRGKIQLRREYADLRELVRAAVEDHHASFERSGLQVETNLGSDKLLVWADPSRVSQILSNLLGNAEKFTPRGGKVSIVVEHDDANVRVRISDTGVGISPEVVRHVFEPFAQAPQTLDRSRGGLGLGLATAKGLAELHGGTIEVKSDGAGLGTSIVVSFPIDSAAEVQSAEGAPATTVRRVLVIDDNSDTADGLRDALAIDGHEVVVAHDGPTGIETARAFHPSVVICDIALPGMDGYQVARTLRADKGLCNTYLVALTGYAQPEDQADALAAGFDRHLAKPVSLEALFALLGDAPRAPA